MKEDQGQLHEGKTEKSFGQTAPSLINDKHHGPASDPLPRRGIDYAMVAQWLELRHWLESQS